MPSVAAFSSSAAFSLSSTSSCGATLKSQARCNTVYAGSKIGVQEMVFFFYLNTLMLVFPSFPALPLPGYTKRLVLSTVSRHWRPELTDVPSWSRCYICRSSLWCMGFSSALCTTRLTTRPLHCLLLGYSAVPVDSSCSRLSMLTCLGQLR